MTEFERSGNMEGLRNTNKKGTTRAKFSSAHQWVKTITQIFGAKTSILLKLTRFIYRHGNVVFLHTLCGLVHSENKKTQCFFLSFLQTSLLNSSLNCNILKWFVVEIVVYQVASGIREKIVEICRACCSNREANLEMDFNKNNYYFHPEISGLLARGAIITAENYHFPSSWHIWMFN